MRSSAELPPTPGAVLPRATSRHPGTGGVAPTRARSAEVLLAAWCLRTSPVPAWPGGLAGTAGDPSGASAGSSSGCHRDPMRRWHWGCREQRWEPGRTGQGEQLQR